MGRFVDYYDLLGVKTDASSEIIKGAYEKKLVELENEELTPAARNSRHELLTRSFFTLCDEQKRIAYDINGEGGYFEDIPKSEEENVHLSAMVEKTVDALDKDPYAVFGLSRNATKEEIQIAYSLALRSLESLRDTSVNRVKLSIEAQRLSSALQIIMDDKKHSSLLCLSNRSTLILGICFGFLSSFSWILAVYHRFNNLALESIPSQIVFLTSITNTGLFGLWIKLSFGCVCFWFIMLITVIGSTSILKRVSSAQFDISLVYFVPVILIFAIVVDHGPFVYRLSKLIENNYEIILYNYSSFFVCLGMLYLASLLQKRDTVQAIALQFSISVGHMILVNYASLLVTGHTVFRAYLTGGLAPVGFYPWWVSVNIFYYLHIRFSEK